MASGDKVVHILEVSPPATLYAQRANIAGASTPGENVPCWNFDDTTVEYMDFLSELRGYGGNGLTFTIVWAHAAATSTVVWGIAIRRLNDDAEDIDTTAHTYDYNDTGSLTVPTAIGEVSYDTRTFTNGADMDNWADGELAIVRVRLTSSVAVGDARLIAISGLET